MIDADELPDGWASAMLKDVVDSSKAKAEPGERNDAPYLGLEHIEAGTSRILGRGVGSDVRSVKNVFQAGDILYGKLRPYLNKVCLPDFDGICSTDILVLKPKACIDSGFLHRLLTTQSVVDHAVANSNGINLPRTSYEALSQFELALPPLAEQRRIVAKIEELTARSRAARAALAEVPTLLEQFRQSVLASAFRGDLTADWREKNPTAEPASVLLGRIRDERRKQWESENSKKEYVEPEVVDDADLPGLPEGWCWCYLPELGYMNRGKSRHRPRNAPELYGGPYPFVQTGDVAQSGGRITSHTQTYSEIGLKQSRLWPAGTMCITIAANIASSAILTYPACFPDSVVGLIPDETLCPVAYAEYFLRTARADLERFAPATAQRNINIGILNQVAVPLAPRDEQLEIVRQLDLAEQRVASVWNMILESQSGLTDLDQSILAKAFRGELVPQDPADEPAAALLARIRSGGSATTPTRSAKRGQVKAYILLLLRTWNKPLGREMLERGLVLMLNADVRRAILGRSKPVAKPTRKRGTPPQFVSGMDALLGEMLDDGWLVPGPEAGFFAEGQHGIDFTAAPPSDLDSVRETAEAMKVLHKDKQQATDADIVSALNGEIYELVS